MRNYLTTFNQQGNKCRALPSTELQECTLEATFSLDPVPSAFTSNPSLS